MVSKKGSWSLVQNEQKEKKYRETLTLIKTFRIVFMDSQYFFFLPLLINTKMKISRIKE